MKKILILLIIFLFLRSSFSQNLFRTCDSLDLNDMKVVFWNNNHAFSDANGNAKFEVPKGSGKTSASAHSLWLSASDINGQLHLSANKYLNSGQDFYPGPLKVNDGSTDTATSLAYNKIWKIKRTEIEEFIYRFQHGTLTVNYIIPDAILNWPAHGPSPAYEHDLAPFYDNNSDGNYNPYDGDCPIIKGDEMLWWVFNDNTKIHTETGCLPLKVEIQACAYVYNCSEFTNDSTDIINHTVFVNYKIINRSTFRLISAKCGLFTDGDIGFPDDDYSGFDLVRNSYFFYNCSSTDGTGQPEAYGGPNPPPPVLAVTLLGGPYRDPDGMDNPRNDQYGNLICGPGINGFNHTDGIVDNERWGFTNYISFNRGNCSDTCEPDSTTHFLRYLNSFWKNGEPLKYGGGGHSLNGGTGPETKFIFPGNSDTCNYGSDGIDHSASTNPIYGWNEKGEGRTSGNRIGLGSTGPFTLEPGAWNYLEYAFVWARADTGNEWQSVEKALANTEKIHHWYINNNFPSCEHYNGINNSDENYNCLKIYPNPAKDNFTIEYPENAEAQIFDIQGRIVQEFSITTQSTTINISDLASGIYSVKVVSKMGVSVERIVKR